MTRILKNVTLAKFLKNPCINLKNIAAAIMIRLSSMYVINPVQMMTILETIRPVYSTQLLPYLSINHETTNVDKVDESAYMLII